MAEPRADPRGAPPAGVRAFCEVRLFGETMGAVAELDSGRILFEYADSFRGGGREPSPLRLSTTRRGPIAFDELLAQPAFAGLPGVLADALPDRFGNQVIRAWFAARGAAERALSPVQRLLYVGERAIGALSFHPATEFPLRAAEQEPLELAALVRDARRVIEGDPQIAIPEIYRVGASAGGMRPKALVLFDPPSRTIRSGHASPRAGERACLLKFDGAGDGATPDALGRPRPFHRVEAAWTAMARAAGVAAAEVELLEDGEFAHLLVTRFDRERAGDLASPPLHQHTLGGLLHVDYNFPGGASYEEYLRTILALGMPYAAVEQGYRRLLFNVLAVNQDDHVKNLSFHMDRAGAWRLAPAYDLTFARGGGFTARHQMRVADKLDGITTADLLALGDVFSLNSPRKLLAQARDAVARMEEFAATFAVPHDLQRELRTQLNRRAEELG
ncbi:MAG: type II toxin-antitoxin system HipA family toxin [Planctomycetes bacterium]|nr:type II toxin-antitoxin system HipA family toxin [Planctomycetota bacterium]